MCYKSAGIHVSQAKNKAYLLTNMQVQLDASIFYIKLNLYACIPASCRHLIKIWFLVPMIVSMCYIECVLGAKFKFFHGKLS